MDRVYDGDLLTALYDNYGMLQSGYWNSVFGNRGCTQTASDYGYMIMDDAVWIYTGITSVVQDESNVGFVLINQRTAETIYMPVSGAEEFSAMEAAQGEVQETGYTAAFPSLINVDGLPTYILCLKDSGGLVKQYALVNVEQYQYVAVGQTQEEALKKYRQLLESNGVAVEKETWETTITISRILYVPMGDDTYLYVFSEQNACYKIPLSDLEEAVFLEEGDIVSLTYEESSHSDIWLCTDLELP